ncbi:MAG: MBL fold metallo-hydrolase [Burkholderiales bacterium]
MTRRTRWPLIVVAVLVLVAGAAWLARVPLSLAMVDRVARERLTTDAIASLPDGLHVGLCGAGSPFPDERRAGPCTVIVAGGRLLVVDAGSGAARGIGRMALDAGRIDAILLTHLHSDHFDGLGELMLQRWVAGSRSEPVPVHGPEGVADVVGGLMRAYGRDRGWRTAHHGEAVAPPSGFGGDARSIAPGADGRATLIADGDLEVVAFLVDHAPVHPAYGFRIRYKDRVVVLSGDTTPSEAVRREAKGADLLVHEALSPPLLARLDAAAVAAGRKNLHKVFGDILDYHTTPEQAAAIARDAGVRYLLLNHIVPPLPIAPLEEAFAGDAPSIFGGPVRVGRDGDWIGLPAGSRDIVPTRDFRLPTR